MIGVLGVGVAGATGPGAKGQIAYPAPAVQPALTASQTPSAPPETAPARTPSSSAPEPSVSLKSNAQAKSVAKVAPKAKPVPTPPLKVTGTRYATAALNVRTAPSFESEVVDVVAPGAKISVTRAVHDGFRFISYNGRGRWISNKYLSDTKPKVSSPSRGGGFSAASCSKSSSIQSGLVPNAIKVYRALCARYPQISSFGGRRASGGFHGTGQAVDVMISDSSVGWAIAEWTRANARALGVSEVIYYQKIWTVERSSDGWRPMSDRGSASANHYDHVHVSVY